MNLDFSKEQKMIRDEALAFLKKECPYERVKELEETAEGYDPKMWKKMADLGWLALMFPESYGGDGGQFIDTAIIMEALGSMVSPSPFFSTIIQCGLVLLEGGSEEQKKKLIPEISDGKLIMSLAQYEEHASYSVSDVTLTAEAEADGFRLNGTKMFVMDANIAHKLIVAAKTGDGEISLFLVDTNVGGVTIDKVPTIALDNNCVVTFENVSVPKENMMGDPGAAIAVLEKANQKAAVAKAAEMLGGCKASIDMTVAYAKERMQYGKPIGGFQAIQHFIANMLIAYDTNYNYLYRVICMVDEGEDFATEAYALKANVNDAYKFISERGVHIHGGIGTTREGDAGLFFRKVKAHEYICGDSATLYDAVFENLMQQV
ncbi:MAG: acyl-CoA/acyl-ACP dehydrogenase [Deltaproteobacteria bacterium]|jgi:alkylation response protein AidB-like acyl-CoA dehydrogenase|nr:acyl-CoA/acyl-ACP dehydrogenase [Deltaproteobacteria bacterium]MBT4640884.1 acyl-CoA/acyl-ACP dehydrogenase [Deltaproteobacteria bacterium]MBT6498479.1 acyl-CoA/acyl-ACP dehydrogenase [Deltaproteobacteria bacterium]MBT7155383.1 acyl-CoA/acyl-ACP dehydrogenase [Deltaproteobacteria bacterium]MBT7715154.1 acyl-CoA/acyl-ACP dehydrogenase [Deltaproteobacteria bacterium]